jgi:asparagine synthase (glutamine-hydrolysing)
MCGIAGIAFRKPEPRFAIAADRMVAALAHRGPDSHGVQDLGHCLLGNARLAIVDLSDRGRQPMCNEDATVWITYNGECYNAEKLRALLLKAGHQFRSNTDTEVIIHAYEEFGESCVEKLSGMFAFAIWDSRTQKLFLARDRLGIKPLYYSLAADTILFGSEIKTLLASDLVPRQLNGAALRAYLELGHIPPPWTAIRAITPLEPGHLGIWQNGSWQTKPYWKLPVSTNEPLRQTPENIAGNLGEILLCSSRAQLMSDVPIALFLSGGVDSAMIGALMQRAGADRLTALTIGFEEQSFNESETSRRTAEQLGISHQVIPTSASEMVESLDHALWAMDQPTMDGINSYLISKAAADAGFKVALSGQGGDELFGGYASVAWFNRFSSVAKWLKHMPRMAGSALFDHQMLPFRWRKLSQLVGAQDPFLASQLAVRLLFLDKDVHQLLNTDFAASNGDFEAQDFLAGLARQTDGLPTPERIAYLDFPAHLEARLLRDSDAMSMAHSLELRPVLLDDDILEFVMALPLPLRLQNKKLFFEAMRGIAPAGLSAELQARPKRGFTFPFARWVGGTLRPTIEKAFQPARLLKTGVLNPSAVAKLWRRYLERPQSVGWSRVWSVFVLARWCEIMNLTADI